MQRLLSLVRVRCSGSLRMLTKYCWRVTEDETPRDASTQVDFVVSISMSESAAADRYKALTEDRIIADHNDEAGFKRRWALFHLINDPDVR